MLAELYYACFSPYPFSDYALSENPDQSASFDQEKTDLLKAASAATADMLGKPEAYVMVLVQAGQAMQFADSSTHCAYLELKSIGLPGDQTSVFSTRLCTLIEEMLGVPANRIYIEFQDAPRHLWGWDKRTF